MSCRKCSEAKEQCLLNYTSATRAIHRDYDGSQVPNRQRLVSSSHFPAQAEVAQVHHLYRFVQFHCNELIELFYLGCYMLTTLTWQPYPSRTTLTSPIKRLLFKVVLTQPAAVTGHREHSSGQSGEVTLG